MKLLNKQKFNIPKKYIYLASLLFSFAVLIQVISTEQNISFVHYFGHVVLFTSIYLFWALTIEYINEIVSPFQIGKSKFVQISERVINAIFLVLANLILTNILYYGFLFIATNLTLEEAFLDFKPYILKSIIIRFFDIVVIGLILKIIETNNTVQKQKIKVVYLENQLHLSQLEALRNQLDPHFLFNTLHTLNTLIGYDDKKARSMIIKVTKLLRKILDKREKQLITFEEELEYFINYLEIEEERFHDRLEIHINVDDNTKDILVPTLILQPLIENAFKHGIAHLEDKGVIKLSAKIEDNIFLIQLTNSFNTNSKRLAVNSTKLGLENLQNRILHTYGENSLFITEIINNNFIASIKIELNKLL